LLYGRYGYAEMTKFVMIRIVSFYMLYIDAPLFSVRGQHE
jgi:hypothetical protein